MAAQEGAKRKRPAAKVTEEAPETAEAPVASEMSLEDLGLSTRVVNVLTGAGLETAQDLLDKLAQGEKIPGVGDKRLEVIRKRLAEMRFRESEDEEAKVEQERQARAEAEQARAEAERAPPEARKAMEAKAENREPPPAAPAEEAAEEQVSFIVRLTVDEQSRTQLTHVEHRESGRRDNFPGLNIQRLAAFMKECISAPVTPEPTPPPAPPPVGVEAPTPEPLEPAISLTVSDVQVSRVGVPGVTALVLNPDEAFVVQARFRLSPEALPLTAQESAFQVQVLARELTSGTPTLLAIPKESLVRNVLEYPVEVEVPGLSPGLYRLLTLVTLHAPINMLDHYEGPIVRVAGVQPSVNPAALLEVPLSQ